MNPFSVAIVLCVCRNIGITIFDEENTRLHTPTVTNILPTARPAVCLCAGDILRQAHQSI